MARPEGDAVVLDRASCQVSGNYESLSVLCALTAAPPLHHRTLSEGLSCNLKTAAVGFWTQSPKASKGYQVTV